MPHNLLMVCTGNTCRSPMAEAIARQMFPESTVVSAGVYAAPGDPATSEAVTAMEQRGLDLTGHRSQPLTAELVDQADAIFTMTQSHHQAVLGAVPSADIKAQRLDPDQDIADPFGGPQELYLSLIHI